MQTARTTFFVFFLIYILGGPEAGFYLYLLNKDALCYVVSNYCILITLNVLFLTTYVSILYFQLLRVIVETNGYPLMENAINFDTHFTFSEAHW